MRRRLDTHTFLWFVLNDPLSSGTASNLISDPLIDVEISPASYREITIRNRQGGNLRSNGGTLQALPTSMNEKD